MIASITRNRLRTETGATFRLSRLQGRGRRTLRAEPITGGAHSIAHPSSEDEYEALQALYAALEDHTGGRMFIDVR